MQSTRGNAVAIDAGGLIRRQKMTTWGILALAVFVSVGMAEWSKRSAMGEKVISPEVLEHALNIAEKIEDRRSSQPQPAGGWMTASRSEMVSRRSFIAQTPSTAQVPKGIINQ